MRYARYDIHVRYDIHRTYLLSQDPIVLGQLGHESSRRRAHSCALARREAKPTLVFHRVMQIPTHMLLLRAKMRRDLDTCDTTTAAHSVRKGRSVSGGRKARACVRRTSGKSCRLAHVVMGSGSGSMAMRFARLDLGADTAIDSSRGCKNSTLVGDDMVVSAAALVDGTLSLVLDPRAAEE